MFWIFGGGYVLGVRAGRRESKAWRHQAVFGVLQLSVVMCAGWLRVWFL